MSKEKVQKRFATPGPRFVYAIIRQKIAAIAVVIFLLTASAIGAYSIKAFSSTPSGDPLPKTKPSFQVSALSSNTTARFKENGKPWINLEDGKEVETSYAGDAKAIEGLAKS